MAPSSDQVSSTPTPTDPNLSLTPTPQSNLPPLATPSMNYDSPTPQAYEQEMENLERLWRNLSLEHTLNETISYVCILVHPQMTMQWNQMMQTPSLPMRLDPPPHSTPSHSHRSQVRVNRSGHPYHTQTRQSRAPSVW